MKLPMPFLEYYIYFQKYDIDKKGFLTMFELKVAFAHADLNLNEIVQSCYFFDTYNTDKIKLEDFTELYLYNLTAI